MSKVTLYQSRSPSGAMRQQVAGLVFTAVAGGFTCSAGSLAGVKPKAGDAVTGADGKRWRVTDAVLAGGAYTLACEPEGGTE